MPTARRKPRRRSTTVRAQALERVRTLVAALSQSARAVEHRTGVTNAQLFLLQQLADATSRSVNDLAALARTQQSTVSIVVARLVRSGLATKHRSAEDGRVAVISITPKGRRLLAHAPVAPPPSCCARSRRSPIDMRARSPADSARSSMRSGSRLRL